MSLLNAGFDAHVYEQASKLTEVGAGVQISPNASRVLHRLGLAEELARTGVKTKAATKTNSQLHAAITVIAVSDIWDPVDGRASASLRVGYPLTAVLFGEFQIATAGAHGAYFLSAEQQ